MSTVRVTSIFETAAVESQTILRVPLDNMESFPNPCPFFRVSLLNVNWPYTVGVDTIGYLLIRIGGTRNVHKMYISGTGQSIPYTFCVPMHLPTGSATFSYFAQSSVDDTILVPVAKHCPLLEMTFTFVASNGTQSTTLPPNTAARSSSIELALSSSES